MKDPRITQLAETLIYHSCQLKSGQKVIIEAFDLPEPTLVCDLVDAAYARGATPHVIWKNNTVLRSLYRGATEASMSWPASLEKTAMEAADAYIGIRGAANSDELSDVPPEAMELYTSHWWSPVHSGVRVPKTRWVVLRYPTPSWLSRQTKARRSSKTFTLMFARQTTKRWPKT